MSAEKPVVAFLGPRASYTHQATLSSFPDEEYDIQPQTTIEDVFAAVQSGAASHGVVPFENSSNGSVVFTLDLFADLGGRYPDILVDGEIYLAVHHCLLGHLPSTLEHEITETSRSDEGEGGKRLDLPWRRRDETPKAPRTLPPTSPSKVSPVDGDGDTTPKAQPLAASPPTQQQPSLSHIRKLYSHPQAWGQCKTFLSTHLKHTERHDVSSTSKAAELVSLSPSDPSIAAVASKIAANLFTPPLTVLAEGIQDNEKNTTRFFIIRHRESPPLQRPAGGGGGGGGAAAAGSGDLKTLVSFTVSHGSPGALADCLAVFKEHDLNLTSINTRPSGEDRPWNYIFFVEIRANGPPNASLGITGGAVGKALEDLGGVAETWRWLGTWENRLRA